ncbi:hypothetical protein HS088_TW15G00302 [Tripterygium wilfordii]|uniref:Uncharacterized protein n=1 Tax=Tripterygium wilfordii TaxID=458696 RepID=A0A7J7CL94_TRIWF|nr:hypothetical protein HS088_TW15G00302 [Tripterygium wilfordii]
MTFGRAKELLLLVLFWLSILQEEFYSRLRRQGIYMQSSLIIGSSISPSETASFPQPITTNQVKKCITTTPSSPTSSPKRNSGNTRKFSVNEDVQCPEWLSQKLFQRLAILFGLGDWWKLVYYA